MNKKYLFILFGIVAVAVALAIVLYPKEKSSGELDSFAQCLASKGITMYGANWCPHCQSQKNRFGSSFKFVPYVECPDDPKRCLAAGVTGYPTWIFPASPVGGPDGRKLVGDQELQKLSDESGCQLPVQK